MGGSKEEWELIKINVDSGAIDNAANTDTASHIEIKQTPMSRSNGCYMSASNHNIFNEGERSVVGSVTWECQSGWCFKYVLSKAHLDH